MTILTAREESVVSWPGLRPVLIPLLMLAVLVLAPAIYGLAAFHGAWWRMAKPSVQRFVAFETFANLTVVVRSLGVAGRLDQRLSKLFRRTAVVHGALAFLVLISRHYFSIPMLLTGPILSAWGGAVGLVLRRTDAAPRLAIVGPWHWIAQSWDMDCQRLNSPTDPIGEFDEVLITFDRGLPPDWTPLLSRALLAGKPVRHVSEYVEEARGVVSIDDFDLDFLPRRGFASYSFPKRLFDIVCVLVALPLVLPIAAAAACGVWATMGSPILFVQARVGQGGKPFRMLKLRTMRPQTSETPVHATSRGIPGSPSSGAGFGASASTSSLSSGTSSSAT